MKRFAVLVVAVIFCILSIPTVGILASDISNALYYGLITISNNGTADTNISTTANISTPNLISAEFLSTAANNTAIRNTAGADVAFMPGYGSNPWVIFVPSIGGSTYLSNLLYTAETTGGKLAHFPSSSGMAISDNTTMAPSDNFSSVFDGYIDTGMPGNIAYKFDAFNTFVDNSGNITAAIADNWTSQTTKVVEPELRSGVASRGGQLIAAQPAGVFLSASFYLKKTGSPTGTANITLRDASDNLLGYFGSLDVSKLTGAYAWYTFKKPATNPSAQDVRVLVEYSSGNATDYVVMGANNVDTVSGEETMYEAGVYTDTAANDMTYKTTFANVFVSAYRAPSEYTVNATADGTNLILNIDGTAVDTETLAIAAPGNSENWTIGGENTAPYLFSFKFYKGGVLRSDISWAYNSIFPDMSGNGNDATPSFRTTSSNPNIYGTLSWFKPISEAKAPAYTLGSANPFIIYTDLSGNITSNFTLQPTEGAFPLSGVVYAIAAASSTPPQLVLVIIATFITLALSLCVGYVTKKYGSGTTWVKVITIISCMGILVALKDWGFDFWMVAVFITLAISIMMASRHFSWG